MIRLVSENPLEELGFSLDVVKCNIAVSGQKSKELYTFFLY